MLLFFQHQSSRRVVVWRHDTKINPARFTGASTARHGHKASGISRDQDTAHAGSTRMTVSAVSYSHDFANALLCSLIEINLGCDYAGA